MKAKEFIFWTICLAVAVVCSFWVIRTYTAKSVINGGAQEVSDNLVFIMQSPTIVMAKDSKDSNHYFAEREFSSVYQVDKTFDAEKFDYEFSLNGRHFASSVFEYGEFICTLDITFVGTNNKDLITDVLSISIKFYSGSTVLTLSTNGGLTANSYWQSYFNSYGFNMRVYKIGEKL